MFDMTDFRTTVNILNISRSLRPRMTTCCQTMTRYQMAIETMSTIITTRNSLRYSIVSFIELLAVSLLFRAAGKVGLKMSLSASDSGDQSRIFMRGHSMRLGRTAAAIRSVAICVVVTNVVKLVVES